MRISDWSSDVALPISPALYSSLTWSVREAAGRDWRGDSGSGSCRDLDGWGFIAAKPRQFARDDRQTPGRPGGRADDQPFESGGQTHHSPGRTDGKRGAVLSQTGCCAGLPRVATIRPSALQPARVETRLAGPGERVVGKEGGSTGKNR